MYKPEERLTQTVNTIKSIRAKVPNAGIVIMECTGVSLTPEQEKTLRENCNYFLDYTQDPSVQAIYKSTDNWDIVKNGTEIMVFGRALNLLKKNNIIEQYDRVHKMSGRYLINDEFDVNLYEQNTDKIIIGPSQGSQFPYETTLVEKQYMARLWSWPANLNDEIIKVYLDSFEYFNDRVAKGGYVDIEHVLYKFLNPAHVLEVEKVGVEGTIAPNGVSIKN